MSITNLFDTLVAHPTATVLAFLWLVIVLHLPYRYEVQCDFVGRSYAIWESVLYRYEYGPGYERLFYHGLYSLQSLILALLRELMQALRGGFLRRLIAELRRWFGW